jgi:hypothetical protein
MPISRSSKQDMLSDWRWRILMKKLILAAFTALSVGAAVLPAYAASSVGGDAAATRMQQTGQYSR